MPVTKETIESRISGIAKYLEIYTNSSNRPYIETDLAIHKLAIRTQEAEEYATEAQIRVMALTCETLEKDKRIEELQEKLNEANRMSSYWQQRAQGTPFGVDINAAPATAINTARLADDIKQCFEHVSCVEKSIVSAFNPASAEWSRLAGELQAAITRGAEETIKKHLQPGGMLFTKGGSK